MIAHDFLILRNKKKLNLIVSKKCKLNILTTKDVSKKYINWLNNYDITKYTEQSKIKHSPLKVKKFVLTKYKSKYDFLFGIFVDNNHIGNIKLGPINWKHLVSDISFFIGDKNYWGKGIASEAVKKVVKFSFTRLKLHKINAGYYENNMPSSIVFKKCGFAIEGVRKNNIIFEGKKISSILVGKSK